MSIKEDVIKLCKEYFDIYLKERDFDGTLKYLSPELKGFGSGEDEFAKYNFDMKRLFKRDIEQAPNEIKYVYHEFEVEVLSNVSAIAFGIMDLETEILGQEIKLTNFRFSILFSRKNESDIFLIRHKHASFASKQQGNDESYPLKELEERNLILNRLVEEKTHELEKLLEYTKKLAITDKLTGLYNRVEIDKRFDDEMESFKRYNFPFSVLLIDVDHFKKINDKYGHQKGDTCLQKISKILREIVRKNDVLGRWGGEEFIVICPNTDLSEAFLLGESIRKMIQNGIFNIEEDCTVSIGVTSVGENDEVDTIIKRVDDNLYRAKAKGRNRVE